MKRGKRADDGWARTSCLATGAAAGEVFVSMFFDQETPRQTERQWTSFNREGNIAPGTVFPNHLVDDEITVRRAHPPSARQPRTAFAEF